MPNPLRVNAAESHRVARRLEMEACPQAPFGASRATWSVDHVSAAVPALRSNAAEVLRLWGLDSEGDQAFAVLLVLTEVVTNAGRHGRPALGLIDVEMWLDGDRVTITVTDGTVEAPVLSKACSDDESGRGLELISSYTESSGYEPHLTGKRVWAVIGPHPASDVGVLLLAALDSYQSAM
ncbi:ATP-binding protein [Kitasatospora sp. NPDC056184]|uniref:ATP-binding protein n=1 Tax=Kitasatospora sp. NPDC056184 TaxID=3345738 RepID=UPI0035E0D446